MTKPIERERGMTRVTGNTLKTWIGMYEDPHHQSFEDQEKILDMIHYKIECHIQQFRKVLTHDDYKFLK